MELGAMFRSGPPGKQDDTSKREVIDNSNKNLRQIINQEKEKDGENS